MKVLVLAVAAVLALPLVAASPLAVPALEPAERAVHHVHMGLPGVPGFPLGFNPSVVVAKAGDVVEFHAHGFHSATSGVDTFAEGAEAFAPAQAHLNTFDAVLSPGGVFSVTLTELGAYPYYCKLGNHRFQGMRAAIVVGP